MLTPDQLEARRTFIGASEVACLTGHSPWGGPFDVFNSKVYGIEKEKTFSMRIGDLLEDDVLELYREQTGAALAFPGSVRHPEMPHLGCTPDAIADGERVVQVKTSSPWDRQAWGEPMTDAIPPQYLVQVQFEMLVLGKRVCDVPVLFGTQEFAVFRVAYDAELAGSLVEIATKFWREHIEPKNPPAIDWTPACSLSLAHRYPVDRAPLKDADEALCAALERYRAAKAGVKIEKASLDATKNKIRAWIGDAEGARGPDFIATWKANKNGKRTLRVKFNGEEQDDE